MNFQVLDPLYWFTLQSANTDGLIGKIFFGFFVLLFIFGIVCRLIVTHQTKDRYLKQIGIRVGVFAVSMGIIGMILFFFSYENIRLFGARFLYVFWAVAFIGWLMILVKFIVRDIPLLRERDIKEHAKLKYFPGKKRR